MRAILILLFMACWYLHIVTPQKKLKKNKAQYKHYRLKTVFGGKYQAIMESAKLGKVDQ